MCDVLDRWGSHDPIDCRLHKVSLNFLFHYIYDSGCKLQRFCFYFSNGRQNNRYFFNAVDANVGLQVAQKIT